MVLSRTVDSEGRLVTKRLHVIYQDVPCFVKAIVGDIVTYAGEESIVDPKTKTMALRTKNLSLNCVASVDELCMYTAHPADASKTDYCKKMTVQGWMTGLLNMKLESWFVDTDKKNRGNGISVMDDIIAGVSQLLLPINKEFN